MTRLALVWAEIQTHQKLIREERKKALDLIMHVNRELKEYYICMVREMFMGTECFNRSEYYEGALYAIPLLLDLDIRA